MRQLNADEKELTNNGIERLKETVSDLIENLEYNKAIKQHEKIQRAFDDKWLKHKRKAKDTQDEQLIQQMQDMINDKQETIKVMNKQLKEGVEENPAVQ